MEKITDDFKEIAQVIRRIDDSNLVLLGAPILENSYDSILSSKMTDMQRLMSHLRFLDCHEAFYLIKNSLYIPKLLFILRSTPLYNSDKLVVLDKCLNDNISYVLNVGLDEKKMMQISLPVKFGGFGIRSLHVLALPAFLSSYYGDLNIMNSISPYSMIDEPYH